MAKAKRKSGVIWKVAIAAALIVFIVGGVKLYSYYKKIYWPNVKIEGSKTAILYIPTGADIEQVAYILESQKLIINRHSFEWLAEQKNYRGNLVVPGKYELKSGMSNESLINHLRAGNGRLEVKVTFNNVRTIEELAGRFSRYLEPDSLQLIRYFKSPEVMAKYGLTQRTFITLFIPNTYKFDWATSSEDIVKRMAAEYKAFWTEERKQKAAKIGLSQSEVVVLASIVQAEQRTRNDERPRIAGLYLNRIRKGMKLQSDPTVIYAVGDFSINRVLNGHLQKESPYNTYLYAGLPPGPILVPDISAVDAVLNAEKNDYIFMCAKEDFSGYHNFATNLTMHNIYAKRYRDALNKRKIYR
jgi:UPF0755 protein